MQYPNLYDIINHHPYHISTFANFANVTTDLLIAAIEGEEIMTDQELLGISKYTGIPIGVLKCPHVITLNRSNQHHIEMIKKTY